MATTKNLPDPMAIDTSYVEMDRDNDPTLIGKHCQLDYCNQLDFLPFHCQSCKKTFCLDHRTEDAHKCDNRGAWADRKRLADANRISAGQGRIMRESTPVKPCADDNCRTIIGTTMSIAAHCDRCNRDYCLPHRMEEDHDCKNKVPVGARPAQAKLSAAAAAAKKLPSATDVLARIRLFGRDKKEEAARKGALGEKKRDRQTRMDNLTAVKHLAKGDEKGLSDETRRRYIWVEAQADSSVKNVPRGNFYFNKDWTVGRMLDDAAKRLQIDNSNNRSEGEVQRLRVFHVEEGELVDYSKKLHEVFKDGHTAVLLRGIGPAIPNLIEA